KDGLFARFPCDTIFGMHNRPGLAIGKFQIRTGPMMAGGAYFDITVAGRGAPGARPEAGIDPLSRASHLPPPPPPARPRNAQPPDTAVVRACQEIIESTFERVKYGFTTEVACHMLWW